MDSIRLPIDVMVGTNPPVFRWTQLVDSVNGKQVVEYMESLPPTVEVAVQRLVSIAKQLLMENVALRGQLQGHCDRIAAQNELLSKKAEAQSQVVYSSSRVPRGKG